VTDAIANLSVNSKSEIFNEPFTFTTIGEKAFENGEI